MTRSLVILTLASGLSLGAAGGVLAHWCWERTTGGNAHEVVADAGIGHPISALDPRDDPALATYATDLFIGRGRDQTGSAGAPTSAPGQELPQSQFAVEVLHLIKGETAGVVTVNLVVTCERLPAAAITPEQLESDSLPRDPGSQCVRAPAGILFHVHRDDGSDEAVLTDRWGELAFQTPEGIGVEVDMPEGVNGRFLSLLGYQPVNVFDRIPANDPACPPGTAEGCKRVYVLVP